MCQPPKNSIKEGPSLGIGVEDNESREIDEFFGDKKLVTGRQGQIFFFLEKIQWRLIGGQFLPRDLFGRDLLKQSGARGFLPGGKTGANVI